MLANATEHCLTTRRFLVRGDGSTAHEGIFDLDTGEFLRQSTHQGWRGDSTLGRAARPGRSTASAPPTASPAIARFLDTAERCADFYIDRTDDSGVPPNDWEEPHPARRWESSAAAIAASGLFQLAELTDDPAKSRRYRCLRRHDPAHAARLQSSSPMTRRAGRESSSTAVITSAWDSASTKA